MTDTSTRLNRAHTELVGIRETLDVYRDDLVIKQINEAILAINYATVLLRSRELMAAKVPVPEAIKAKSERIRFEH